MSLEDKAAITDLIYRYCRAVDRIDVDLGRSIWHADAVADYGDFYRGPGRDVIDLICSQHERTLACSHQVTNILIEVDGDRAASESYAIAALRMAAESGERQITVWTRYLDRWSKRGGQWALDKRQEVRDFDEIRDVQPVDKAPPRAPASNDPSSALFGATR